MRRAFRITAFIVSGLLFIASCGSRVVPLQTSGYNAQGQPIANPTANGTGGPSTGPSTGPGGVINNPGLNNLPGINPACHGGASDRGVTASTIKLGLVAAKTGSFPGQFDPNVEAVDAYLKMINAAGGVCHRQFQLFTRDDGGNESNDETRALELARDVGIFAFVGSISAPDSDDGVAKASVEFHLPDVGFPLSYLRTKSPLTYGVPGQLQKQWIGVAASGSEYLNRLYGVKQIAILWVGESLVSKANAWAFEAAMLLSSTHNPSGRIKVCFEQESNVFDNQFETYASRMKGVCPASAGPLAVYSTMENTNNIKLADAMLHQNVPHAFFDPTFTSYLPSFARDERGNPRQSTEGAYIAMPQIPFERCSGFDSNGRPVPPCSHPELDRYVRALRRFEPGFKIPGSFGAPGWGQAALFVQAVAACGANLTRTCVLHQLDTTKNFSDNGFLSPTNPGDHLIYSSDLLMRVHNGRFVEVKPNAKNGPPDAPDFWDVSHLFNWWDYYCADSNKTNDFPDYKEIDQFVTTC